MSTHNRDLERFLTYWNALSHDDREALMHQSHHQCAIEETAAMTEEEPFVRPRVIHPPGPTF